MRIKKLIVTLFVLVVIVAVSQIPQGISHGMKQWLTANGGEQVKVGDVDFNLLSATFALYDLAVERQGGVVLNIPELQIRLTWTPFLSKQLLINRVMIKGVRIAIDRSDPENILIGGITLPAASKVDKEIENASLPWGIGVEKLEIFDSEIQYRDKKLDVRFRIEELILTELASYRPEQKVKIKLDGAINDAPIMLKSQITPFSDAPSLTSEIDLQMFNLGLLNRLAEPNTSHIAGYLSVKTLLSAQSQPDAVWVVNQKGELALKQLDVQHGADRVEAGRLQWDGGVQLKLSSQGKLHAVLAEGAIQLKALDGALESQSLMLNSAEWLGRMDHQAAVAGEQTDVEGELSLNDLLVKVPKPQAELKQQELSWRGKVRLEKPATAEAQLIILQGVIASTGLGLQMPKQAIEVSYDRMAWDGDLQLSQGGEAEKMELTGQIDIDQLQVLDVTEQYLLLAFDQLKVEEMSADLHSVEIESKQVAVGQLAIGHLLKGEGPGLLQVEELKVAGIHYSAQQGVKINSIEPQSLTHLTRRDREGRWNEQQLLNIVQRITVSEKEARSSQSGVAEKETDKALAIRIDNIQLSGESNLEFQDDLQDPPYQAKMDINRFTLDGLNSAEPNRSSPMVLDAALNQRSTLKLEGSIAPFAPQLTLALKGQLEGFGLPPLTSYTGALLGYSLDSGELNADIVFDAKAGNIQGDNKLKLHQLDVSPLSEEKMKGLNAQLDIPLDTALGMLRDSDNTISLELPLSGSVNDLKIDPSDAINQAIGKALKKGATTYLTAALFPFGTMLAVAKIAGEEAAKIRLDPIMFSPASDRLQVKNHEYLGKIATILRERPEVHIKVCGRATMPDQVALLQLAQQALDKKRTAELAAKKAAKDKEAKSQMPANLKPTTEQQLKLLADKRAAAIESYLVDKEGIKPNRLISCLSIAELDDEAAEPRVELLL